ncbi:hypothetical protein [Mycoplana dimorpha]|uniref:Transmembrane protein n=1 Tax=Mycoplana dimorpha TaxID=28320 RepID=A0A2T5B5B4_MYCDI|nr:hypothetical protein [Mycoplana dimorpha]PTM94175.1 hypothetical protein C7449_10574 [Mycoplana dimorpha]
MSMDIVTTAPANESARSAISWAAIIAGALAAAALTLVLLLVGSGLGLTMVSPWAGQNSSLTTIGASAAAWLVVVSWLSSLIGGYITGRLRTKWVGIHTDETFFRDTAHGFLSWSLATLFVAWLMSSTLASILGAGTQAAAAAVGATGAAATTAATSAATAGGGPDLSIRYFTDTLLRPGSTPTPPPNSGDNEAVAAEVGRILLQSAAAGEVSADDRAYLNRVVAARTGLSEADATARVDQVLTRMNEAKVKTQQAADTARKTAATAALLGALALVVGAFIASAAAAFGGRLRDDEQTVTVK